MILPSIYTFAGSRMGELLLQPPMSGSYIPVHPISPDKLVL